MKNYKERFPELNQYLGGLFHQAWKEVFEWNQQKSSFEGVVRYFKLRNSECYEEDELFELKKFLSLDLSKEEIEVILRNEWGIAFRPAYINLTHREWLEEILRILEEPIEETKKHFIPEFIG